MSKKSLIISLVLTFLLMLLSVRLHISHDFWINWDNKDFCLEVYNTGNSNNAFAFVSANKVKIEQPDEMDNPSWLKNAGMGMRLQFKLRSLYFKYSAGLKVLGDGKLKVRFNNFEQFSEPKNAKIDFRKVVINGKTAVENVVFEKGDMLPYELNLKNGDIVNFEFEAKRYLNLYDLFFKYIDWYVFIILLTISFCVSYKVVCYLAQFKIKHNTSRIDIVFIAFFFLLLFVPMSNISDGKVSDSENRVLAEYVPLYNGKFNYKYGQQFEKWFNDRFLGRKNLIELHGKVMDKISLRGNNKVIVAKNNWLFLKSSGTLENFRNAVQFSDEELKKIASYLVSIDNWCRKNGKDFYYVICPDKNKVYGENITFVSKLRPDSEGRTEQLVNYLIKNTDIKVIYLRETLLANKGDNLLYFKNDTHWTTMGGYIGYTELMNKIREKHKDYSVVKFDKTKIVKNLKGDLNKMYPTFSDDKDTEYEIPIFSSSAKCISEHNKKEELFCKNIKRGKKLVLYRDSFSDAWLDFLSETFGKVSAFRRYDITREDLKYLKHEADIIVMEQVERFVSSLVDYKFPEEN